MQSAIHEGYEYQDYFTVSIILQLMFKQTDAEITIDRKNFNGDKFDDLKVMIHNGITEFQIKYSDDETFHELTKGDLANGNGHDTASIYTHDPRLISRLKALAEKYPEYIEDCLDSVVAELMEI